VQPDSLAMTAVVRRGLPRQAIARLTGQPVKLVTDI